MLTATSFTLASYLLIAYLLGSIPTGYWVAKKLKNIDIREHGSGNTGATNVGRVVGKKAGLFVLLIDFLKGFLPVLALRLWLLPVGTPGLPVPAEWIHTAVAILTMLGHSRSIFLKFAGGKAAITGLGAVIALMPLAGTILGALAYTIIKLSKTVSIGSMTAAIIAPFLAALMGYPVAYQTFSALSALLVVYLHRSNIKRLLAGTENRLS
ncbi:MAG: glycerol-3-phosphate 1-O-acyltransferase PlsY [Cyanobacteria bacterium]|nr:glycerol-3-phosphate 1-O-acyltransferase PlsY [Cyanobacteriota bacterium]